MATVIDDIEQTISSISPLMKTSEVINIPADEDAFVTAYEANNDDLVDLATELQTFRTQLNTTIGQMNTANIETENNANIASSIGNYQGVWSNATTYSKTMGVSVGDLYYISKVDNNLNHAVTDTNYWTPSPVNTKLEKDFSSFTDKSTPVNADLIPLSDSAAGFGIKKLSWANIKNILFGNTALTGSPTINGVNLSPFNGYKNLLINPNFLVNQRGYVSGTNTTAANQYCHDRWRVPVSGQNVTFTKTNNVVTVTAPAGGYEQVIEDINVYSGDYKISHEGTATVSVAESTDNITYTTLTINANGTYTLTGGKYVRVRFSSGTIIKPQVEIGSVRTYFENRPIGLELSLCYRYYELFESLTYQGYGLAGNVFAHQTVMKSVKRTNPTITIGTVISSVNCGIGAFTADKTTVFFNVTVSTTNAFVATVSNVAASSEL